MLGTPLPVAESCRTCRNSRSAQVRKKGRLCTVACPRCRVTWPGFDFRAEAL